MLSYMSPADIAEIVDNRGVRALYQVIVTPNGVPVGVETLARLHHPELGVITPNQFIEISESNGLINAIGLQIASLGFEAAEALGPDLSVSINISPIQLYDHNFARKIKEILSGYNISPNQIEFEITEMSLLRKNGTQFNTLNELIDMGFLLALDDFGVGWSGLSLVRSLPFHRIKVDQSFVASMMKVKKDKIIVDHLVNLAQKLDLRITVEGVESQDQAIYFKKYPNIHLQGYFFGRPTPLNEIISSM